MTQSPQKFVAHDVSDLINALPTQFGFRPAESVVAIATHGPRRRFGFRMRMDVPSPEHVDEVAKKIVMHLAHQGAEGAIVIALTEKQDLALALLDAVHGELDAHGIDVIVRARADGRRYWTDAYDDVPEGTAYSVSDHHLAIVHAVAAGQQIVADRETLVARFAPVGGERREWLFEACEALLDEIVPQVARAGPDGLGEVGSAVVGPILDRALAGGRLVDADLLRVAVWVSSIAVRDRVWTRITRDNAEQMLQVLTQISRSVVPPFEPAVLSLASFAAWLTGDGTQALIAVERALEADPDYSMARLVLGVLEGGVSPEHWGGFSEESLSS